MALHAFTAGEKSFTHWLGVVPFLTQDAGRTLDYMWSIQNSERLSFLILREVGLALKLLIEVETSGLPVIRPKNPHCSPVPC